MESKLDEAKSKDWGGVMDNAIMEEVSALEVSMRINNSLIGGAKVN